MTFILSQRGFTLLEVLIAVVILSVTVTAFIAGISQSLRLSQRSEEITQAVLKLEASFSELETGERSELVRYGGRESRGRNASIEIKSEAHSSGLRSLVIKDIKNGKERLSFDAFLMEGGLS